MRNETLPTDAQARNDYPMADGLLYYFPAALAAVARVSKIGNDQHNPGQPMHWARGKSTDHANKIIRHQMEAGTMDTDGTRHSAKVAWRALAQLQEELEREEGAPLPRNAKLDNKEVVKDAARPFVSPESLTREQASNILAQPQLYSKHEFRCAYRKATGEWPRKYPMVYSGVSDHEEDVRPETGRE